MVATTLFLKSGLKQQQAQQNPGMMFPQFIIEPADEENKEKEKSDEAKVEKENQKKNNF